MAALAGFSEVDNKRKAKRKREPSWTRDENVLLLEGYRKTKRTIQSKFNPAITNRHEEKMWQEVIEKLHVRNLR